VECERSIGKRIIKSKPNCCKNGCRNEAKFEKYWNISYLSNCIPVILDPRFKFGFIEFLLNKAFGETARVHIDKVDKAIRSLYSGYSFETKGLITDGILAV
jgi:hypothetical protein